MDRAISLMYRKFTQPEQQQQQHGELHRGVRFAQQRRRKFDVFEQRAVRTRAAEDHEIATDRDARDP